ncbi:hypothetical protein JXJ21_16435 [candidate division KSB1 bacterium]|nr:hypothetical protein [candidate division KSB1 bacterium]
MRDLDIHYKSKLLISLLTILFIFLAQKNIVLAQFGQVFISGYIRTELGEPIRGVEMRNGADVRAITDQNGFYEISAGVYIPGGFAISPKKSGWTFEPAGRIYGGGTYTDQDYVGTYSGGPQSTIITFDEERYRNIRGQRIYHGGPNTLIDTEAGLDYFVAFGEMYVTLSGTDYMMFFSPLGASGWDPRGRIVITFNELKQYVRIKVSSDYVPVHTPAYLRVAFYKNTTPTNPLYFEDGAGNIEHTSTENGIKMLIIDTHFTENNIHELEFISLEKSYIPLSGTIFDGQGGPLTAAVPYTVIGDVEVPSGQTLTMQPGTQIYFEPGYKIIANGLLNTIGNPNNPVLLYLNETTNGMKVHCEFKLSNGGQFKP